MFTQRGARVPLMMFVLSCLATDVMLQERKTKLILLADFPIFVASIGSTRQIWIGLLYVDDLALMSTSPRELQAMPRLHVCQQ